MSMKRKYRILQERGCYYVQCKDWFFWDYMRDWAEVQELLDGMFAHIVHFETVKAAEIYIESNRSYRRDIALSPKKPRIVKEM